MNKKLLSLLVITVFLLVPFGLAFAAEEVAPEVTEVVASEEDFTEEDLRLEDIYEDLETFASALTIIEKHYVDVTPPRDLIYGALEGMLTSLDPYSQFLDPEGHLEIKVETAGKFGGIGVEISIREDVLTVISPIDGTPADEGGVLAGDKIVKIDDESTRGMSLGDAVKVLRGKIGTEVVLTIYREDENRVLEVNLIRELISVKSIKRAFILQEGIGYLRLSEFQENTPKDFAKALSRLEKEGMNGLILDLRNNPGGLLPEAIKVAELLVPRDQLIVAIKGRTEKQNVDFISKGSREAKAYPIVVLVNRGSASASEIVAGALQDHRLALLLGTKTFGKGSVQTVIPMRDGSAIRLTTSKYYTPSGRLIHGKGLMPDVEVKFKSSEPKEPTEEEKKEKKVHEIFNQVTKKLDRKKEESKSAIERLKKYDNQVQRAMDLIKALNVYDTLGINEEQVQEEPEVS